MVSGNDLLMSGGVKTANLKTLNKWVSGIVASEPQARQKRDMQGNLETWDNGDPRMEVLIDIEIEEKKREQDGVDDGLRRFYVSGRMLQAVRAAVRAAGADGVRPGGQLAVRWVGEEAPKTRGFSPTKLYEAAYKPPAQTMLTQQADDIEPDDLPF